MSENNEKNCSAQQSKKASNDLDECPLDNKKHPDCEQCVYECVRGDYILMRRGVLKRKIVNLSDYRDEDWIDWMRMVDDHPELANTEIDDHASDVYYWEYLNDENENKIGRVEYSRDFDTIAITYFLHE